MLVLDGVCFVRPPGPDAGGCSRRDVLWGVREQRQGRPPKTRYTAVGRVDEEPFCGALRREGLAVRADDRYAIIHSQDGGERPGMQGGVGQDNALCRTSVF